jgi:threonine synthase
MNYISTRGRAPSLNFTDAFMTGLATDGGLYVPDQWPTLSGVKKGQPYVDTALAVLSPLVAGTSLQSDLKTLLNQTYVPRPDGFTTPAVTPLKTLSDQLSVLELFHGPTIAFKDVALQFLGQLFDRQLKASGQSMTILGATSGDTGSAAIEGCRHAAGADIYILYPHGRPSEVQRRQMTTVNAPNVHAIAVVGSFDDCQAIVKDCFNDPTFRASAKLSAVNSINWARIAAQIVYYVQTAYSYDEPVTFVVPTGNFGNVYAAYAAYKMGAPIRRLVVASNRNDILSRFLNTGKMEARTVEPSLSPSMDIQVSSNFERLLFEVTGRDGSAVEGFMNAFKSNQSYVVSSSQLNDIKNLFVGASCDDTQTLETIKQVHADYGYLVDPHTAVGLHAYNTLKNDLEGPVVALACAHPAKFPDAVEKATGMRPALPPELADLYDREERFTVLPADAQAVKDFIKKNGAQ